MLPLPILHSSLPLVFHLPFFFNFPSPSFHSTFFSYLTLDSSPYISSPLNSLSVPSSSSYFRVPFSYFTSFSFISNSLLTPLSPNLHFPLPYLPLMYCTNFHLPPSSLPIFHLSPSIPLPPLYVAHLSLSFLITTHLSPSFIPLVIFL